MNKNYNNKQITSLILDTADKLDISNPRLKGLMGHGLLNARRALRAAAPVGFVPQDPREIINLQKNNAALWVGDKVDKEVLTNNFFNLSISFKNKGSIIWQPHFLKLSLSGWQNQPVNFSPQELFYQNSQDVLPSQTATFYHNLKAPKASGIYQIKFQLNYNGQDVRGGAIYKTVQVISSKPAIITEDNLPIAVRRAWGTFPITLKITNNTEKAWTSSSDIALQIKTNDSNFYFSNQGIRMADVQPEQPNILPNGTATFIFEINFINSSLGLKYYTLQLRVGEEILEIERRERLMRID
jgi:hypothetical protein